MHLPFSSKWLFVGTERGNVHVVNIESFQLSGYTINWNKAIEIKCKTHPGPVVHISGNPVDPNKLLLGFESGIIVVWSLRGKTVEHRCTSSKSVVSAHWLNDGKQFMCSHTDGTLTVWSLKNSDKPVETLSPHTKSDKGRPCQPIFKVQWLAVSSGDPFVLFSGGTCGSKKKGLTLMQGRSLRVLCTDTVLDFECITSTPWGEDVQDPKAVVVLTPVKLLVFDLLSSSAKSMAFEIPYTFNIHDSPITCTQFCSDCPRDFLSALGAAAGSRSRKRQLPRENSSPQAWPINGGILNESSEDATGELIVTGHSDGSVKFWAATSAVLRCLYKLSTSKIFEKNTNSIVENNETNGKDGQSEGSVGMGCESSSLSMVDIDCYTVNMIELCLRSRTLLVAGTCHVIVYQFSTAEETLELVQLDINMQVDLSPELSPQCTGELGSPTDDRGDHLVFSATHTSLTMSHPTLSCKTGLYKRSPGFQPLVCCLTSTGGADFIPISSLAVSSEFGVVCISNGSCLALVDVVQKKLITVLSAQDMTAVSESPAVQTPTTPVVAGTPLTFSINPDGSGGEFHVDLNSKIERRKSRPPRPPPPARRLSAKSDQSNGSDGADGLRQSKASGLSLDFRPPDNISCLQFACTFTKKNDNLISPSLWVGTALGNVFVVVLNLPVGEQRESQPVLTITTGTLFHPKAGVVLSISILDGQGHLFPSPFQFWKDKDTQANKRVSAQSRETLDRHFVAICTERDAKVYSLPTSNTNPRCFSEANIADDMSVLLKATAVVVQGSSCLLCLNSLGKVLAFSLPNLLQLMDVECTFLLNDYRFLKTLVFSEDAQALILCSPFEIQRLSMFVRPGMLTENQGSLFSVMETPEPPSKGFFSSLFSTAASPLDREQLFGVESGNASRSLTDRFNGPGMEKLQETSSGLAGVVARNRQALLERGEKLSELEIKTEQMNVRAKAFADAASQLSMKYKEKKWYQV
ncbi:syntaxin-binding protein 5-like isoform X2 [Montipora capricornis]